MTPNYAERQARALEGIKSYMHDLVKVFTAVNQNLVTFAKLVQENQEGPSPDLAQKESPDYVVPVEGYASGMNYEEMERRSVELLHNNPAFRQIPPEEGE